MGGLGIGTKVQYVFVHDITFHSGGAIVNGYAIIKECGFGGAIVNGCAIIKECGFGGAWGTQSSFDLPHNKSRPIGCRHDSETGSNTFSLSIQMPGELERS